VTIDSVPIVREFVDVFPEELPSHFKNFNTASNGILTTTVITKHPITIEFFPGTQKMK
ncbi:hypothetical protein HAX54_011581, partial [Datura stramonium]|nr:hypothetical protein [Datura stramonium]